ncbi:UNVERIFIED_CONTAM: spermidine/putrescine transport system substrate-binding protein [Brevibacillus sp. OAP136]
MKKMWSAALAILTVMFSAACGSADHSGAGSEASPFQGKTLNVMSWEGYQEPNWVKPFEEKYGVTVNVTYAGSVDDMFAKVQAGSVKYDLIFVDGGSVKRYQQFHLIQPIDTAKLTHVNELIKQLKEKNDKHVVIDGQTYALPFAWGSLPMMVNTKKVKEPVNSWEALWNQKYKGKVITMDDANNQVAMTGLMLGISDPYDLNDGQMAEIKAKLIQQKSVVKTYYSGFEDGKSLMASGEAWLGYAMGSTMISDLKQQGLPIEEVIPKEGALVWVDNAVIGQGTENLELVHKYLDYLISADVQTKLIRKTGYGGVNQEAANLLTPEEAKAAHMDDQGYFDKLVYIAYPESFEKRVALWNQVKAAQ